jgi:hypothetical protein
VHYADLLERYAERATQRLGQAKSSKPKQEVLPPEPVDNPRYSSARRSASAIPSI